MARCIRPSTRTPLRCACTAPQLARRGLRAHSCGISAMLTGCGMPALPHPTLPCPPATSRALARPVRHLTLLRHPSVLCAVRCQVRITLPPPPAGQKWCRVVDTNLAPPKDITPGGNAGGAAAQPGPGHVCGRGSCPGVDLPCLTRCALWRLLSATTSCTQQPPCRHPARGKIYACTCYLWRRPPLCAPPSGLLCLWGKGRCQARCAPLPRPPGVDPVYCIQPYSSVLLVAKDQDWAPSP